MTEKKLSHAGAMKAGSYILINDSPCIVKDTQTSRPGKHGHAKVRIKATDIFTGSTKEVVKPGHDSVEVPIIYKKTGQVLSISGEDIEIMDMESFENVHCEISSVEEGLKIEAGQTVMFWLVMGKVIIKGIVGEAN